MPDKIKVLVVEDSLVFRSLLVKHINADPDLQVIAVANDPFEARDLIIKYSPDVMTLDIELPRMSGLEFLSKLMPQYPLRTIVISSLSDKVFEALRVGAVDFVAKPAVKEKDKLEEFVRKELPDKIKVAAKAKLKTNYGVKPVSQPGLTITKKAMSESTQSGPLPNLDRIRNKKDLIVAIGASTGGTEATTAIVEKFGADIPGVVVTQHMPEGFTKMYADRLDAQTNVNVRVKEAEQGDIVTPGHIYIAPGGDRHMEVIKKNGQYVIMLKEFDKVNGHRPSVEVLFESVAKAAGDNAVGIILTGMGGDGAKGLLSMKNAGAKTIGQDESTCVVYGMPRVAYEMGAVEYQEKLMDIPSRTYYLIEQIAKKKQLI